MCVSRVPIRLVTERLGLPRWSCPVDPSLFSAERFGLLAHNAERQAAADGERRRQRTEGREEEVVTAVARQ